MSLHHPDYARAADVFEDLLVVRRRRPGLMELIARWTGRRAEPAPTVKPATSAH
jgi:hypothetical protein